MRNWEVKKGYTITCSSSKYLTAKFATKELLCPFLKESCSFFIDIFQV
ncbi:MAG: hypothetical protein E6929_13860 [Clostridium sp.]|nr:hypothetical protein [Clostridium sp.]